MSDNQMFLFGSVYGEKTWTEKYRDVLSSSRWKRIKTRLKDAASYCCSVCGVQENKHISESKLDIHHITYKRLGCEVDSDLQVVCKKCHVMQDKRRAAKNRQASLSALYDAQFDGWALKVYGEEYCRFEDFDMHERFAEWKEIKDYDQ